MGGMGVPPKLNRQRRITPARGDWKQLEPLDGPVLMPLSDLPVPSNCINEGWPFTAVTYWESWRASPVTALWTEDDIALAIDTISHYARTCMFTKGDGGVPLPASELRLRMESLGLTPAGRVKFRYLLPEEQAPAQLIPLPGGKGRSDHGPGEGRSLPEAI